MPALELRLHRVDAALGRDSPPRRAAGGESVDGIRSIDAERPGGLLCHLIVAGEHNGTVAVGI
jgi:hypothetical protein